MTKEKLQKEKPFQYYINDIEKFFKNAIIMGFNHTYFDIGFLNSAFARCGKENFIDKSKTKLFDAYLVFKKDNNHKLINAVKYYTGEDLADAHNAQADVEGTLKVVAKQLEKYQCSPEELYKKLEIGNPDTEVSDESKFIIEQDGKLLFNFSKNKGQHVKDADSGFIKWINGQSFVPKEVKAKINDYIRKTKSS